MLSEIQMAIAAITGAKTIAEGLGAERDTIKLSEATANLLARLIDAQSAVLALQSSQALLQDDLARLKNEKLELEKRYAQVVGGGHQLVGYELAPLARGSVFVYAQSPDKDGSRNPPYLCTTCFGKGEHSVLGFQKATAKTPSRLVCPASTAHALDLPRGAWTLGNIGRFV